MKIKLSAVIFALIYVTVGILIGLYLGVGWVDVYLGVGVLSALAFESIRGQTPFSTFWIIWGLDFLVQGYGKIRSINIEKFQYALVVAVPLTLAFDFYKRRKAKVP
jgi:hypothetical protein